MKILFESQMYPKELEVTFVSNSKVTLDFAANNFCNAIIKGFAENNQNIRLVNLPNLGSFPSLYKKPWAKGARLTNGESVGFCNITYLKRYDIRRRLYRAVRKELNSIARNEKVILLIYNNQCLPFLKKIKSDYPNVRVCQIVTDLPEYMVRPKSKISRVGKCVIGKEVDASALDISEVDGFILLAPKMSEKLKIGSRKWIQMEGIYESGTVVENTPKDNEKVILYTGNLSQRYGIINLLDAFAGIQDKNYRLWLRGSGDCEDEIINRAKIDKRISLIPALSRKELLKLQKKATVLINPVSPSEEFTRYFFPSKTLEYLASGTPVLMYRLSCLPKEYDEHLIYIDEDSVEGIRKKVVEVCNKPVHELKEKGQRATLFIMNNKTPKAQIKKIVDFLKEF